MSSGSCSGAAAATYAWTLGLAGPSGPDSGLFPFIAALIVMGAGVVLLLSVAIGLVARISRGARRSGGSLA